MPIAWSFALAAGRGESGSPARRPRSGGRGRGRRRRHDSGRRGGGAPLDGRWIVPAGALSRVGGPKGTASLTCSEFEVFGADKAAIRESRSMTRAGRRSGYDIAGRRVTTSADGCLTIHLRSRDKQPLPSACKSLQSQSLARSGAVADGADDLFPLLWEEGQRVEDSYYNAPDG